jgi:hypothetical protein
MILSQYSVIAAQSTNTDVITIHFNTIFLLYLLLKCQINFYFDIYLSFFSFSSNDTAQNDEEIGKYWKGNSSKVGAIIWGDLGHYLKPEIQCAVLGLPLLTG